MTYEEVTNWLFNQLASYQQKGASAYKADLSNITTVCNRLGNPQNKFKSIHIAGTNGKGSSSHMLASVLQEAGYKTGLYTSPHLKDFRERIRVNGQTISEEAVIAFTEENKAFFLDLGLSFFEMTVAMAFSYFAEQEVDVAIIEVGLGGRLDATNIIHPELCLITNISLDHTNMLGNTVEAIAKEKAGIIKPTVPVVIGEKATASADVFQKIAKENQSTLYWAEETSIETWETDLKGSYQKYNLRAVLTVLHQLQKMGWDISEQAQKNGLAKVIPNTGLLGRWQQLGESPSILCDTGHNEAGIREIVQQLQAQKKKLHIVFGMVNDKNAEEIIQLLPKDAQYYLCAPSISRAMPVETLKKNFKKFHFFFKSFENPASALIAAKSEAKKEDLIFVGGSTFVVAEII